MAKLRALAPTKFAEKIPPSVESLIKLVWQPALQKAAPPSRPEGDPFQVVFINESKQAVELKWMDREGVPKPYGKIGAHQHQRQQTRPGAVWLITNKDGQPLGHFEIGDRTARAIIPGK